jgi:hypothetical protein
MKKLTLKQALKIIDDQICPLINNKSCSCKKCHIGGFKNKPDTRNCLFCLKRRGR